MSEPAPTIELDRVSRRYGNFLAVDGASVTFSPGAIHAVIGENGAGKSTLLKLAAGALDPSSGDVRVRGAEGRVGLVHQHFMLVGAFRAIENVVLGHEPIARGLLDLASASAAARSLMESAGLDVPLDAITSSLTVGQRQRLEILRVLYHGARAVLLDEPTAVLSPLEAAELYATLRRLADDGATIVVVTHRLDEVTSHADHVTVMRRGRVVMSEPRDGAAPTSVEDLTRAIMGGSSLQAFAPPELDGSAPIALEVKGLRSAGPGLAGVDLEVRAGEIVGVAGVEGNGQRPLVRALAGLDAEASGRVAVGGRDLARLSARERRPWLGVVHEDRHEDGLVLDATVADNLVLGDLAEPDEAATMKRRLEEGGVVPPDPRRVARELSGGNQQKIVIARVLDRLRGDGSKSGARAIVLAQPTRGVDVGAADGIHRAIGAAAASGVAVLVLSADLAELRRLSHRLVVLRAGRIVAELPRDASETTIGRAMLGLDG